MMRTFLLSAAASLALLGSAGLGSAMAQEGAGNPFGAAGEQGRFVVTIPTVDTGSQAYLGGAPQVTGFSGLAAAASTTRDARLVAGQNYQYGPDTGGEQMPVGLR